MNKIVLGFTKVTGLLPQYFYYKKKIYYENKDKQSRKIKGGSLLISNHFSVFDYPLIMFTFFSRSIRVLIAEIMYRKNKFLSWFLPSLGGIKVDRNNYDFSFTSEMINVLKKGQVGLIFPESRVRTEKDDINKLLDFKPSYVYIALESGVPIIPLYHNGHFGRTKTKNDNRARIIIGEPINVYDLYDDKLSEKENITNINNYVSDRIYQLRDLLNAKVELEKNGKKEKKKAI